MRKPDQPVPASSDAPPADVRPAVSFTRELELRLANARLSRNDERILSFLRDHLDELAFHTSESIAQGAGVSRAAIVRFARRLGYSGFAALRAQHREQLHGQAEDRRRRDADAQEQSLLTRKVRRDLDNLELLPEMLGPRLEHAAAQLAAARDLWLLANRETHGLLVYLYRLLHHVRSRVHLIDPAFPDPLRDITADDALLACTFRPYARQTVALIQHARGRGAAIIVLTDGYGHGFLEDSDTALAVSVESPTVFLSFVPALCALEALASSVARIDAEETYETLEATDRFVESQRLMLEPGRLTGIRRRSRPRGSRTGPSRSDAGSSAPRPADPEQP
ncbi:MAG TPA: MurR/RpiR family transcriptional regulator [Solirubrobacteraceae bacterium]|nr:MurR/RpiR family transcriptional regulator [Solirubrobacteraceae bacterium]